MIFRKIFAVLVPMLFPLVILAQDTSKVVVRENYKREFVIDNKRYRVYDNWVNAGAGYAWHSENPRLQFSLGLDFNFHITKLYFNFGGMLSGDAYGVWNNYQGHIGYVPYRRQNMKYHKAVVAAISFSRGYEFVYAGHYLSAPFNEFGLYGEYQLIRKIEYVDGLGAVAFVNVNSKNIIAGIRLEGYLSGAYRGYVKGKEPHQQF